MSYHVLLNILNEEIYSSTKETPSSLLSAIMENRMRGLPSVLLLLVCNEFSKLNDTGERVLDSIYHMTLTLLWSSMLVVKMLRFCKYVRKMVEKHNTALRKASETRSLPYNTGCNNTVTLNHEQRNNRLQNL